MIITNQRVGQQNIQNQEGFQNQRSDLFDIIDNNQFVQDDPNDIKILNNNNNSNIKFWISVLIIVIISLVITMQLINNLKNQADSIKKQTEDETLNLKQFSEHTTQDLKKAMQTIDNKIKQIKRHGIQVDHIFTNKLNDVSKQLLSLEKDTQKINQINLDKQIDEMLIDSQIIQKSSQITKFFKRKIKQLKLLYRATENDFMVSKFHAKCDNTPNTIVLIRTQYNKIIGGFTNLKWDQTHQGIFEKDEKNETFIFSVNMNQIFWKSSGTQVIKNYRDFGPVFAGTSGPADLIIFDRSNISQRSFAQFPNNYNNEKQYKHSRETTEMFVGSPNQRFKINEWEVFQVIFQKQ